MCHENCRAKSVAHSILYVAAVIAPTLLSPGWAGNYAEAQNREKRIEARQAELRSLSREKLADRQSGQRLTYQKIKEDFTVLQVMNNNLSEGVGSGSALNYTQIRKDAAEIKKCVARLKTNLSLPEAAKDEKPKKNQEGFFIPEDLPESIKMLDGLVKSFALNPIFQEPGVLDVRYSVIATRDLETIGSLSEHIHKRAKSLSKAAAKKP